MENDLEIGLLKLNSLSRERSAMFLKIVVQAYQGIALSQEQHSSHFWTYRRNLFELKTKNQVLLNTSTFLLA